MSRKLQYYAVVGFNGYGGYNGYNKVLKSENIFTDLK